MTVGAFRMNTFLTNKIRGFVEVRTEGQNGEWKHRKLNIVVLRRIIDNKNVAVINVNGIRHSSYYMTGECKAEEVERFKETIERLVEGKF